MPPKLAKTEPQLIQMKQIPMCAYAYNWTMHDFQHDANLTANGRKNASILDRWDGSLPDFAGINTMFGGEGGNDEKNIKQSGGFLTGVSSIDGKAAKEICKLLEEIKLFEMIKNELASAPDIFHPGFADEADKLTDINRYAIGSILFDNGASLDPSNPIFYPTLPLLTVKEAGNSEAALGVFSSALNKIISNVGGPNGIVRNVDKLAPMKNFLTSINNLINTDRLDVAQTLFRVSKALADAKKAADARGGEYNIFEQAENGLYVLDPALEASIGGLVGQNPVAMTAIRAFFMDEYSFNEFINDSVLLFSTNTLQSMLTVPLPQTYDVVASDLSNLSNPVMVIIGGTINNDIATCITNLTLQHILEVMNSGVGMALEGVPVCVAGCNRTYGGLYSPDVNVLQSQCGGGCVSGEVETLELISGASTPNGSGKIGFILNTSDAYTAVATFFTDNPAAAEFKQSVSSSSIYIHTTKTEWTYWTTIEGNNFVPVKIYFALSSVDYATQLYNYFNLPSGSSDDYDYTSFLEAPDSIHLGLNAATQAITSMDIQDDIGQDMLSRAQYFDTISGIMEHGNSVRGGVMSANRVSVSTLLMQGIGLNPAPGVFSDLLGGQNAIRSCS